MPDQKTEKRRFSRFSKDIPAISMFNSEVRESVVRNISEGGAFVEICNLHADVIAGFCKGHNRIDLVMNFSESEDRFKIRTEIAWMRWKDISRDVIELGLRFIEKEEDVESKIKKYLSEIMRSGIKKDIEDFLGLEISEAMLDGKPIEVLAKLDTSDIKEFIPERGRAFFMQRAVIFKSGERFRIFATSPITHEICDGHLPGFPMLPLGIAGWILSQGGEILVSYLENHEKDDSKILPLVCKTGPVETYYKEYILCGKILLLAGELKKKRMGISEVDTEVWIEGHKAIVVNKMLYRVLSDKRLWN